MSNEVIPFAIWPDNLPHADEKYFIMVIASEQQYRWALFERYNNDFHPCLYWRTAVLNKEDMESDAAFVRFVPEQTKNLIYGTIPENKRQVDAAISFRSEQRIPSVTVFCLLYTAQRGQDKKSSQSSNLLFQMLHDSFPCNVYQLRANDFWPIDHTAFRRTAEHAVTVAAIEATLPSRHCFLIDGGATTLTLTILAPTKADISKPDTADRSSSLNGETNDDTNAVTNSSFIEPTPAKASSIARGKSIRIVVNTCTVSIERKLQDMHEQTGALPEVSSKQVLDSMSFLKERQSLFEIFARNTEDAMIGNALRESILYIRLALKEWAETLEATENEIQHICSAITTGGLRPVVFVSGNEEDIIVKLLTEPALNLDADPDFTWIDPPENSDSTAKLLRIRQQSTDQDIVMELKHERYMAFHGISPVLRQYADDFKESMSGLDVLRQEIRGRLVAKKFGNHGVFFGHVSSVTAFKSTSMKEDFFTVRYDDGEFEDYDIEEIYQFLLLFSAAEGTTHESPSLIEKRNESARVAELIAAQFPSVRAIQPVDLDDVAPSLPAIGCNDASDYLLEEVQTNGVVVSHVNDTLRCRESLSKTDPAPHEEESSIDASPPTTKEVVEKIVGCHVAKDFGAEVGGIFVGRVTGIVEVVGDTLEQLNDSEGEGSLDELFYSIKYEDDDEEDYSIVELYAHLNLYGKYVDNYSSEEKAKVKDQRTESLRVAAVLASVSDKVKEALATKPVKAKSRNAGSLAGRGRRIASNSKRAFSEVG